MAARLRAAAGGGGGGARARDRHGSTFWRPTSATRMLRGWNDTAHAVAARAPCRSCSPRRSAETPDAIAVVFERRSAYLRASSTRAPTGWRITCARSGVGPETVVGLCVERSPEMVVGLLGILKAGGAYLPLDPEYPRRAARRSCSRTPARRCWSRTRRCSTGCRRSDARARAASTPTAAAHRAAARRTAPALALDPHNPAYVIYTSGSTGSPRAWWSPSRRSCNLVAWTRRRASG